MGVLWRTARRAAPGYGGFAWGCVGTSCHCGGSDAEKFRTRQLANSRGCDPTIASIPWSFYELVPIAYFSSRSSGVCAWKWFRFTFVEVHVWMYLEMLNLVGSRLDVLCWSSLQCVFIWTLVQGSKYLVSGFVQHVNGHFIAFVRCGGRWWKCDDSIVTGPADVSRIWPTLIFLEKYRRRSLLAPPALTPASNIARLRGCRHQSGLAHSSSLTHSLIHSLTLTHSHSPSLTFHALHRPTMKVLQVCDASLHLRFRQARAPGTGGGNRAIGCCHILLQSCD